jgi:4-methylaminobutanoate oxidase (formaldehyde-forming)
MNSAITTLKAREGVALFDQTSLSKLIVSGPDAGKALEHVCSAKVVRAEGRCVYTLMLNEQGGIESDCVVTRLKEDQFMLQSGSAMRVRCAFSDRNSHSRMPLVPTPVRLKRAGV